MKPKIDVYCNYTLYCTTLRILTIKFKHQKNIYTYLYYIIIFVKKIVIITFTPRFPRAVSIFNMFAFDFHLWTNYNRVSRGVTPTDRKYIYISSDEVYGNSNITDEERTRWISYYYYIDTLWLPAIQYRSNWNHIRMHCNAECQKTGSQSKLLALTHKCT